MSWSFKKGDQGYSASLTLLGQGSGQYIPLSGLTATLFVWRPIPGGTSSPLLSGGLTIVSAPYGQVSYFLNSGDIGVKLPVDTYNAEVQLTSSGYQQSTSTFTVTVQDSP